ncbi:YT521-B-like domain-containing protein [Mycena olivaceomarginata]|nr:YT521-B-like domain-containing protein [Mycena olivaceomarginata]
MSHTIKGLPESAVKHDGSALRVAILKERGVKDSNIVVQSVPGSFELPLACQRVMASAHVQAGSNVTDLLGGLSFGSPSGGSRTGTPAPAGVVTMPNEPFNAVIAVGVLIKAQDWNEDEVVGEDWVGGVGAVDEKSSLHRQSSLPTWYHRAFQPQSSGLSRSGSLTPNTKNSLTAIAGHEGDEDDWEGDIDACAAEEEHPAEDALDPNSPLAPHDGPSPPPGDPGQQASKGQPVPPIPQQYMHQQQQQQRVPSGQTPTGGFVNTPVDVPSLIASKGYNPTEFNLRPNFARFFVIKSYTEDDVHKSLKYEIWSSTEPGNKRLDKAFKECGGRGPIYLFFSVNASGHFCGMAEMLTPVDYTRSSTVWASGKWKGVFKCAGYLNTTERKPVTNSRDTQELLAEAGQEMLRIFHTHPARTSLLQDFAFYEVRYSFSSLGPMLTLTIAASDAKNAGPRHPRRLLAKQPHHQRGASAHSSPPMPHAQPAQFGGGMDMGNPNALAYQMPQMTPMVQMQMMQMGMPGMGMPGVGMGGAGQFGVQAMHQSVMRHPSPGRRGLPSGRRLEACEALLPALAAATRRAACMPFIFCTTFTFTFLPFPSLPRLSPSPALLSSGPRLQTARTNLYLHRTVTDLYCSGLQR